MDWEMESLAMRAAAAAAVEEDGGGARDAGTRVRAGVCVLLDGEEVEGREEESHAWNKGCCWKSHDVGSARLGRFIDP